MGSARGLAGDNLAEYTAPLKNKKLPKHPRRPHQAPSQAAAAPKPSSQVFFFIYYNYNFRQTMQIEILRHHFFSLYCKHIDQQGDVVRSARVPLLYACRCAREKLSVRESDRRCPPLAFCPKRISVGRAHHHRKRMHSIRRFRTKLTFRRSILHVLCLHQAVQQARRR